MIPLKLKRSIPIISALAMLAAASFISPKELVRLPREPVYPGQAPKLVSDTVLDVRDFAINRRYKKAEKLLWELTETLPDDPFGPAALMVVYQLRMIENEEFFLDAEMRRAGKRAHRALNKFKKKSTRNAWYYTTIGATLGIEGIYHLWRNDYVPAGLRGYASIQYMEKALEADPQNWEARLGLGVYTYYRSVYAAKVPFLPDSVDKRKSGLNEIMLAGQNRKYLDETARIGLCRIAFDDGRYDDAKNFADGLIKQYPDFLLFYIFAARGLFEAKRYEEALPYYKKAYGIDPSLPFAPYRAGRCCEKLGKVDDALEWYKKSARAGKNRNPDKWGALAEKRIKILDKPEK